MAIPATSQNSNIIPDIILESQSYTKKQEKNDNVLSELLVSYIEKLKERGKEKRDQGENKNTNFSSTLSSASATNEFQK